MWTDGEATVQDSGQVDSPVDNQTYNLLQILTSKLEAVEAYSIYEEDMSSEAQRVLQQIADDDRNHVTQLLQLLGLNRS
jgi:hypothetical protein